MPQEVELLGSVDELVGLLEDSLELAREDRRPALVAALEDMLRRLGRPC